MDDVEFFNHEKQPLDDLANLTLDDILYFNLRYKKQKNDRNFEKIPYYKDLDNPKFCPVTAIFRIVQRSQRLAVPDEEPLGVFKATQGRYKNHRCFITNDHVAVFLRKVASTVFKLKPKDEALKRWTTHSIRVTACNLLHRQGFSGSYIQTRLRWTSDAFLMYLRNTLYTAAQHTKVLHIPSNNLPVLTDKYTATTHPSGEVSQTKSAQGIPLVRYRKNEEIENVMNAHCASAA